MIFRVCLCFNLFLLCLGGGELKAQTTGDSLAGMLARAPQVAGPAPAKYTTPFLITRVVPKQKDDDTCFVEAVTNGISFELFADGLAACHHLPELHAIEWGRRLDRLTEQSVQLVYTSPGQRVKAATYFVKRSTVIPADWTEDR